MAPDKPVYFLDTATVPHEDNTLYFYPLISGAMSFLFVPWYEDIQTLELRSHVF